MIQNTKTHQNIFSIFPEYSQPNAQLGNQRIMMKFPEKDEIVLKEQPKENKKRKILFGSTIASTILTAGIIGLVLAKGVHGGKIKDCISKAKNKLAQDLNETSKLTSKDLSIQIVYNTKKAVKKLLDILEASSNFTTFKDWSSNFVLHKTKPTKVFADKSTSFFKGVVDKTLGKKYNSVEVDIKDVTSMLKHYNIASLKQLPIEKRQQLVNIKGVEKTLDDWINLLEKQTQRLENTFDANFSKGARKLRDVKRQKLLKDLPLKIQERFLGQGKKSLFNPENYKTYSTSDLSMGANNELRKDILKAKKEISNNISSIVKRIKTNMTSLSGTIKPTDEATRTSLDSLKSLMEKFKNCSGKNEAQSRQEISKEITKVLKSITASTTDNKIYTENEKKVIQNLLKEIQADIIDTGSKNSKGALEEIMTILKGLSSASVQGQAEPIISKNIFNDFAKMSKKISEKLKVATDLEMGEYFLKQAELKVGSAPTDVISVLFPIGVGAYSIAKGDDKDEKISAVLTTCIPLVGTFATFVYGTSKMLSGAKNLIFSGVSGVLLGLFGDYCDKLYKKYKNKPAVSNVVKDGYDIIKNEVENHMKKYDEEIKEQNESKTNK